jgi:hypothetical protein
VTVQLEDRRRSENGVPTRSPRTHVARFIAIAAVFLVASCEVSPRPSSTPLTGPPATPAETTRGADTPPPLNRLEVKVVDALARLGIVGQRAQLPFENASIYAQSGTGASLFVNAWPPGATHGDFTVIDHRQLGGVPVELIRYPTTQDPVYRFACSQDTYEVGGTLPPTFQDMDTFVSRLIDALGCRP